MRHLAWLVLVALIVGGCAGLCTQGISEPIQYWVTGPIGKIWLNLLLVMMLPLATSALVLGVQGVQGAELARLGLLAGLLTVGMTVVAVVVGVVVVVVFAPGVGVDPSTLPAGSAVEATSTDAMSLFTDQFPKNIVSAAAKDNLVPVLVFTLLFAIALKLVETPAAGVLRQGIEGLFDVSSKAVHLVLYAAPIGVACLTYGLAAKGGVAALLPLLRFVGVVLLALGFQMLVVYPLVVWLTTRRNPVYFFWDIRRAMAMAFSTASSAATLPTSLDVAEEDLGIPRDTARFVLTVGATGNQNGTALFEGIAVVFIAQLYGVELSIAATAGVMVVAILGGIGTAGVPGGALPVITAVIVAIGIPPEAIGVIVGVDRLLDMCRTTLNVTGDLVIASAVARRTPLSPTPEAIPT